MKRPSLLKNILLPSLQGRGCGVSPLVKSLLLSFFIFHFSFFLFSCKPSLPPGILSESKMEAVLYDYHMALATAEVKHTNDGQSLDVRRYLLQESVLRKHGITQEDFDTSMSFYCSDLARLNEIYKRIEQRLEREAQAADLALGASDIYAGLTAEGDTANVWTGRSVFAIRNRLGENMQSWQINCDSTWLAGDDILWRFHTQAFTKDELQNIYITLVVTYTNDSIRAQTLQMTRRSNPEISIENPDDWSVRSIYGHFFLAVDEDVQHACVYIVNQLSLIRFHKIAEEKEQKQAPADSLAADSLAADRMRKDSLERSDSSDVQQRYSPMERRDMQTVDRKIEIVKEKPYTIRKRGRQGQGGNRRRRLSN